MSVPAQAKSADSTKGGSSKAVVVELFTSLSCSQCVEAQELLRSLEGQSKSPLLVLQMHVDIWDEGWRDPYGSQFLSNRQRQYASLLKVPIEAPFFVVDGSHPMSGADASSLSHLISQGASSPKARIRLALEGNQLEIEVEDVPARFDSEPLAVWLLAAQSGLVDVPSGGLNSGKRLAHGPVVRDMSQVGLVTQGEFKRKLPVNNLNREKVSWVVLLQSMRTGAIAGAASVPHPAQQGEMSGASAAGGGQGAQGKTVSSAPLSEAQAYSLAEEFVKTNGYTEHAAADLRQVSREVGQFDPDLQRIVLRRKNTLRPRAVGISQGRTDGSPGFSVYFGLTHNSPRARVVTFKPDGSGIRMEAGDRPLTGVQRHRTR